MTIQDRKSRENTRLKKKILDAALRIFAEKGYGDVTMRKIAAQIEYSPTTIYRFFRNKEDLLATIAAQTVLDLSERVAKIRDAGGAHPLVLLKTLIRDYVSFCAERPDMFRLFSDLATFEMEDGIMYERLGETRYMVYQSWFHAIRESVKSGFLKIEDERRIFLFLWDSVQGYIDHIVNQPGIPRKPPAADADEFLGLLFHGIEKEGGTGKERR